MDPCGRESRCRRGGGVFVGGVGALVGVEEGEAGLDGVLCVAGLVEDGVGGVGEGGGQCEGDGCDGSAFQVEWGECESDGEAQDCCEDRQDAPGELEEGEFGDVVPDECCEGGEEEDDGYGEDD